MDSQEEFGIFEGMCSRDVLVHVKVHVHPKQNYQYPHIPSGRHLQKKWTNHHLEWENSTINGPFSIASSFQEGIDKDTLHAVD